MLLIQKRRYVLFMDVMLHSNILMKLWHNIQPNVIIRQLLRRCKLEDLLLGKECATHLSDPVIT